MDNRAYNSHEKFTDPSGVYPQMQTQGMNQQGGPHQVVAQQPMSTFVMGAPEPQWTWCHLVTSVISIFCCQIFGFIATVMAILSYTDHRVKDFTGFRSKKSCALGFAVAGIVLGSIIILIIIIVYAVLISAAVSSTSSYNSWNK